MRKICVFTATRAEYGLLKMLMRELDADPDIQLQVLCSGAHLSSDFGMTIRELEKDGFRADEKVEILDGVDGPEGVCRAMGRGVAGFQGALERLSPDILVLLGDRYEAFACAASATVCRIPVAHIHGGEATFGQYDEPFRHSITKMSHLHFTSAEAYRQRVIQLGEHPDRVWNVGGLGVEAIKSVKLVNRQVLSEDVGLDLDQPFILVTFHPVTLENVSAEEQFGELVDVIIAEEGLNAIFTHANSDTQGNAVNAMISDVVARYPDRFVDHVSLGQLRYLSVMRHAVAVVGNSSSGILEAPSMRVPTVDIGNRQKGRIQAQSVVHCEQSGDAIRDALRTALSDTFRETVKTVVSPYEGESPSTVIKEQLLKAELSGILKKEFYDLMPGVGQKSTKDMS